jgi:MYXO-CTERM domain-containing protein
VLGADCADCGLRADPSPDAVASCGSGGNYTDPIPVAWLKERIEYVVDSAGYMGIPEISQIERTVDASFATWNSVSESYVVTESGGLSDAAVSNIDMINVITFVEDDWPYAPAALAIASVTYTPCGEIVDADIELNADQWSFRILGTGPVLATSHDLQNTLTHEIGHFLGFDHCHDDAVVGASNCEEATMRIQTEAGDITMRDLSADDLAAAAHVYPNGGAPSGTAACPPGRRSHKRGCSLGPEHPPSPSAMGTLGLLALTRFRRAPRSLS